jgi:maltase-glucoamylase
MVNSNTFRFSYRPQQHQLGDNIRWTVPDFLLESFQCDQTQRLSSAGFEVNQNAFGFSMQNPSHRGTFFFSTLQRNLVMSDKYMEVGLEIHSHEVFGWGERTRSFTLEEGEYTIWPTGVEKGPDPAQKGYNTFGDHPFVLARLQDRTYLGLYLKNSNAKVLHYSKYADNKSVLNFITTGGVLDVFAFTGDTAEQVLRQYHKVVGEPQLPPLWALGFQQGSATYVNDSLATKSIENYRAAEIPLESLLLDENFMEEYRPFNVDKVRFRNINALKSELYRFEQRLVLSLHACIPVYDPSGNIYSYFSEGLDSAIFIKSANATTKVGGETLIGEFLPGKCAYIDYHNPLTFSFWARALNNLYAEVHYDGLQFNFNEITQHCDGECPPTETPRNLESGRFENLPWNPLGNQPHSLNTQTVSLDGRLNNITANHTDAWVVFNNKGIYGTQMMQMSNLFLESDTSSPLPNLRSFITSRSTFSGAGQYGGHFLGHTNSTWEGMRHAIAGILNFNMFGMPLVGPDVCGTTGEVSEELCARWYQLATVIPYARSYYNGTFGTREAWALTGDYLNAARNALNLRLSLIRYFYTTMFEAHRNGGSLWRPLFFEFPQDDGAVDDPEHTFMIGRALKFTPVLQDLATSPTVDSYFPAGVRFIDTFTWQIITGAGQRVSLTPNWSWPLIHMREGSIVPYQEFGEAKTTTDLVKRQSISLVVFQDQNKNADGTVYVDSDGIDVSTVRGGIFQHYRITMSDRMMRFVLVDGIDAGGDLDKNQNVHEIVILDAANYSDTDFACMFNQDMDPHQLNVEYNDVNETLIIKHKFNEPYMNLRELRGIQFGNSETDTSFCQVKYTVAGITVEETGENAGKQMLVELDATGTEVTRINALFTLIKDNLINVDFQYDLTPEPFQMPEQILNTTLYPFTTSLATEKITSFVSVPSVGSEFYFIIHLKDRPGDFLYSTQGLPFVYTPFYKSMQAKIDTNRRVFGLGERFGEFFRGEGTFTVWNRGPGEHTFENGETPGNNLYSSHPVYFVQRSRGTEWFGVYEHNSGPQDFIISPSGNGYEIDNIKTSGRTNMFFMMNDKIQNVVQNYYNLVGKPVLLPRWAYGWHQSRFGYNTTQALRDVFDGFRHHNLPLDGLWSDIDVLHEFRDFTVEEEFFEGIKGFVNDIKELGTRYVPIVASGISAGNSGAYSDGKSKNVLLMSPGENNEPFLGRGMPGDVVFIDFFAPNVESYWINQLNGFHGKLNFDGIWLDMNEVTSFCTGACYDDQRPSNPLDNRLFYWPGGRDLETGTLPLDIIDSQGNTQLDTHSLHGIMQMYYTSKYFTNNDMRPFVISRSTFAGSGKYGGNTMGDVTSEYLNLRYSIENVLLFNSFAVPFTGADVCGFLGNASDFLCAKWYKAAATVYPFARNHNNFGNLGQEPWVPEFTEQTLDEGRNITAFDVIRNAMFVRYGLHVYMYTQYHKASTNGTQPIKPLFYNYPDNADSYNAIHDNVLLGDHIKASPDSDQFGRVTQYFPGSGTSWCPIWENPNNNCITGGTLQVTNVRVDQIDVHIRSGSIVPLQLTNSSIFNVTDHIKTLEDLHNEYTDIGISFDGNNFASGDVIFDDGETLDLTQHDHINFTGRAHRPFFGAADYSLTFNLVHNGYTGELTNQMKLGDFIIYNARSQGFTDSTQGTMTTTDGSSYGFTATYYSNLQITKLTSNATEAIPIRDIATVKILAS